MKTLSFDPIRADVAITEKEKSAALHANALLHNGQGAGNDFLGWVGLPSALDEEELQAIETEAARLRDLAEVILCIGIGGSYLGARAVYEALSDPFNLLYEHPANPILLFVGQNLSEGELLQLSNVSNLQFSEEIYFDVIRKKTAVLFAACTKAGALSVGVTDEQAEFARLFGEYIGLCFQIKDDIFDYYDSKEIGKPTGNDMLEGKLTLPVLYALNSTCDKAAEEIAMKVKDGSATSDEIARLIEFAKQYGGIEYAIKTMYAYKEKALSLLETLADTDVKAALVAYLDFVVDRDK